MRPVAIVREEPASATGPGPGSAWAEDEKAVTQENTIHPSPSNERDEASNRHDDSMVKDSNNSALRGWERIDSRSQISDSHEC
jgi:hypothetical protein